MKTPKLKFYFPLDTKWVILEMFLPSFLLDEY